MLSLCACWVLPPSSFRGSFYSLGGFFTCVHFLGLSRALEAMAQLGARSEPSWRGTEMAIQLRTVGWGMGPRIPEGRWQFFDCP